METLETGAEKVLHGGFDDPYRGAGQISGPAASEGKRHVEFRKPIKNRVLRNSTRVPPVCCPDDGLDLFIIGFNGLTESMCIVCAT